MVRWLTKILIDNGWVRLGLAFRWFFGTKDILTGLVNESSLDTIQKRYQLIEESGFFSDEDGPANQQAFIHALFAYDEMEGDAFGNAALNFSY